jgi:3-methyl-2-oxobutanoate hydroxymethyltransferase
LIGKGLLHRLSCTTITTYYHYYHHYHNSLDMSATALAARSFASLVVRGTRPSIVVARPLVAAANHPQVRNSSHSPMGLQPPNPRKKVTIGTLRTLHKRREPITVITAHDFPSAHVADHAGMDMILVGDSLAMVALGMEDTSEVLLEEMLLHCRSVARATKSAFTVSPPHLRCCPLRPVLY